MVKDKLLLTNIAADRLGCTTAHIYNLVRDGHIDAVRIGKRGIRISEQSLDAFIQSRIIDPDEFFE